MTHPIDDYLEGRIPRSDLGRKEMREAEAAERVISQVRAFVDEREAPDVTRSVMRRIAESMTAHPKPAGRWRAWLSLLWQPREMSFRFRPVYGALAVSTVVALVGLSLNGRALPESSTVAGVPVPAAQLFVQFRLQAPEAMTVRLAGTFTDWQPRYELHESAPGIFTITLPLSPGVHDYVFVVNDEQWVPDPHAPQVDDGFGGRNSRIALLTPDVSRS